MGDGEFTNDSPWINIQVELLEDGLGILVHLMLVNQAKFGFWEAAQPDIFHDATFKNLIQFLMDHGDALFQRLFWVVKAYGLAIEFDTTGVLDIDTEETFHHS